MAPSSVAEIPADDKGALDEDRLAELGYKQELNRNWGLLHNFGISFSIIVSGLVVMLESLIACHMRNFNTVAMLDEFEQLDFLSLPS